ADHSFVDLHAASGTFQSAARRVGNIAAFTDRRSNTELELFGHRDFDLRVLARRTEDPDAFDIPFRSDDRELFLASVLPRLREIRVFGQLMTFAEQCFDVLLSHMNVVR